MMMNILETGRSFSHIGTDQANGRYGNAYYGIHIGGNNNIIKNKTIAYKGLTTVRPAVAVDGALSYGNRISQNSIHGNGGNPIDLLNGGNQRILGPILLLQGDTLSGDACPSCTVDFFKRQQRQRYQIFLKAQCKLTVPVFFLSTTDACKRKVYPGDQHRLKFQYIEPIKSS